MSLAGQVRKSHVPPSESRPAPDPQHTGPSHVQNVEQRRTRSPGLLNGGNPCCQTLAIRHWLETVVIIVAIKTSAPLPKANPATNVLCYLSHCYSIYHGADYKITCVFLSVSVSVVTPTAAIFIRFWWNFPQWFGARKVRWNLFGVQIRWPLPLPRS